LTISKERAKLLWELMDQSRGNSSLSFLTAVHALRKAGEQLNVSELIFIQELVGDIGGPSALPNSVARFFSQLVGSRNCKSVLDPAGSNGLLGAWLSGHLPLQRIDVISRLSRCDEITQPLGLKSLIHHVGTINDKELQLAKQYDAIVACGPVGLKRETRTYGSGVDEIELCDDPACLLIADVADRLSLSGFIASVMAPRFAWEKGSRTVRKNLPYFGLHLSALLTFQPGIFAHTSISFILAIITKERHNKLFVAAIPEDSDGQNALVDRLWKRSPGTMVSQGRLVSEDQFNSFQQLESKERAANIASGKGFNPITFDRVVREIRVPKRTGTKFERCDDHPDAVYLPEMAKTAATTRQENLPEKLKSYFQLLVNPEVVLPEYLAELLNTPLGHSLRQSVMTGTTIPRINKDLLKASTLYIVPIPDQEQALEAKSEIHRLRNELSELETDIWEYPRKVARVTEALGRVNHEERFEEWIETLPFPLASILRSYHALDQKAKEKYERLLYFFEALTEFFAAIHLSAFQINTIRWQKELVLLRRVLNDQHLSLERATFGLWRVIFERLAGSLRSMLNGAKEERAVAFSLYAVANSIPLEMLSSKSLVGLVQRVNSFRNRWTGHGGAVTPAEAEERHNSLRKELEEVRTIIGQRFLQYQLLEPRKAEILEGPLFRCRVRRVMGSNPQLEHQTVTVTTPLKTGVLYLNNPGHDAALELIPIVQMSDTPQPASYFYNRCEDSQLHLVSYHFAEKSEITSPGSTLSNLFSDFEPADPTAETET